MPRNPNKRRCAQPGCRAWAMADSPYCRAHRSMGGALPAAPSTAGESPLGIYAAALTPEERRLLEQCGDQLDLAPEIWLLRIMSRRLFLALSGEDADRETIRRLASVLYQGLARLAELSRARRALSGEAADGLAGALAQALEEIETI